MFETDIFLEHSTTFWCLWLNLFEMCCCHQIHNKHIFTEIKDVKELKQKNIVFVMLSEGKLQQYDLLNVMHVIIVCGANYLIYNWFPLFQVLTATFYCSHALSLRCFFSSSPAHLLNDEHAFCFHYFIITKNATEASNLLTLCYLYFKVRTNNIH